MTQHHRELSCEAAQAILDDVARRGGAPSPAEAERLAAHRAICRDCAVEWAALGAIRFRPDDPPVAPLDDLAEHRLIQQVLQAAARPEEGAPVSSAEGDRAGIAPSPERKGRRRRLVWAALAAGFAGLLAGGILWWGGGAVRQGDGEPEARSAPRCAGILLLRARGATLRPQPSDRTPGCLRLGDAVVTEREPAALALGPAVRVHLGPASEVRLAGRDGPERVLVLARGDVVVSVTPGTADSRFRLETPRGSVRVHGTVFQVRVGEPNLQVAVVEGVVSVAVRQAPSGSGNRQIRVQAGYQVRGAAPAVAALSGPVRREIWRRADVLGLLTTHRSALLIVDSHPGSAEVLVDGISLGRTPVRATVAAGSHRVILRAPGFATVEEHVVLRQGGEARRDFGLSAAGAPPARAGAVPGHVSGAASESRPQGRDSRVPGAPARAADSRPKARGRAAGVTARRPGARAPRVRPRRVAPWVALFREAQALRAAQNWSGAAAAYRRLIALAPGRPEARIARVSLGFLQLEHLGQPARALRSFERYLAAGRSGALAREAAWGRVRALRALGRREAERRALARFLERYPGSVHAAAARARLSQLAPAGRRRAPPR